jgi:DNA polymerase-4
VRLLGIGVSGLSVYAQGDLFAEDDEAMDVDEAATEAATEDDTEGGTADPVAEQPLLDAKARWWPGQDVVHDELGPGWVWGRGLGRVTVRFEGPRTPPGPVRTLAADDPALQPAEPPDWRDALPDVVPDQEVER